MKIINIYIYTYNLHKVHGNRTKWVCIVLKSECLKNTWCSLASGGPILITGRDQGDGILGSHWSGVPESWPFIGWEPRGVTPHSSLSSSPWQWSSVTLESPAWFLLTWPPLRKPQLAGQRSQGIRAEPDLWRPVEQQHLFSKYLQPPNQYTHTNLFCIYRFIKK